MCIRDRFHPECPAASLPGWCLNPPVTWWKIDLQTLIDRSGGLPFYKHKDGVSSCYGEVPLAAIVGQRRRSTVANDFETVWANPAYQVRGVPPGDSDDDLLVHAELSPRKTRIAGELTPSGVAP
eukprot:11858470-Alexandrium_andersonii.AAC.1